jgi:hypothetical protein
VCADNSMLLSEDLSVLLLRINISHPFILCLFLSSVCRIPFRIFCSGGLVIIYCFSLSQKTFITPSILNDSFAGQSILFYLLS